MDAPLAGLLDTDHFLDPNVLSSTADSGTYSNGTFRHIGGILPTGQREGLKKMILPKGSSGMCVKNWAFFFSQMLNHGGCCFIT